MTDLDQQSADDEVEDEVLNVDQETSSSSSKTTTVSKPASMTFKPKPVVELPKPSLTPKMEDEDKELLAHLQKELSVAHARIVELTRELK